MGVADRVNVGLIPSSEPGWPTALAALRLDTGGILHVHTNVTSGRSRDERSTLYRHVNDTRQSVSDDDDVVVNDSHTSVLTQCRHSAVSSSSNQPTRGVLHEAHPCHLANDDVCKRCIISTTTTTSHVTAAAVDRTSTMKFAKTRASKPAWHAWADRACETLRRHLSEMQRCDWSVSVMHIEHVKSYAPHIDHIVVDIECRPPTWQLRTAD